MLRVPRGLPCSSLAGPPKAEAAPLSSLPHWRCRSPALRVGALLADFAGDAPCVLGLPEPDGPGLTDWLDAGATVPVDALSRIEVEAAPGLALLPRGAARADAGVRVPTCWPRSSSATHAPSSPTVASGPLARRASVAAAASVSLLVVRPCYVALRRALAAPLRPSGSCSSASRAAHSGRRRRRRPRASRSAPRSRSRHRSPAPSTPGCSRVASRDRSSVRCGERHDAHGRRRRGARAPTAARRRAGRRCAAHRAPRSSSSFGGRRRCSAPTSSTPSSATSPRAPRGSAPSSRCSRSHDHRGHGQRVDGRVDRARRQCSRAPTSCSTTATVAHLIERVVSPLGLRVDRSSPLVDARLPDGSRVNAVVPPVAIDGPCLTIRRFGARTLALEEFCSSDGRRSRFVSAVFGAAQHPRHRRHRQRQDHVAEQPGGMPAEPRAHRHDRRRRRAPLAGRARRPARGTAREHRGARCDHDPRARAQRARACAPTASSSARSAGPRRSTCSKR